MFFKKREPHKEEVVEISERDAELLVNLLVFWNQNYKTYIKPSKIFDRPTEIKKYRIIFSVIDGICVEIIDEYDRRHIADVTEWGKINIREERF